MRTIYLIGFMGSGKSTVGTYLERNYNVSFIDTDDYIEQKYRKEIPAIFEKEGENQFRQYEIEALKSLKDYNVVATGGGIVERDENYQTMKNNGIIIYLQASFHEIMTRLQHDASRPLWNQDTKKREKLYERRHQLYESYSDEVVLTEKKDIEEIGRTIMQLINEE